MKKISIYTYDGSGSLGATYTSGPYIAPGQEPGNELPYTGGGFPASLASMLVAYDPLTWEWHPVEYKPMVFGAAISVERGLEMGRQQIAADPNYIVLSGLSQGTFITGNLYNEFRYGALQDKRDDLIAIVNFGDAMRPPGWTIPPASAVKYLGHSSGDVLDPGGSGACRFPIPVSYGVHTGRLVDPEPFYWAFAMQNDMATTVPNSGAVAQLQSDFAYTLGLAKYADDGDPATNEAVTFLQDLFTYLRGKFIAHPIETVASALQALAAWIPMFIPTDILGIEMPISNPHAKYADPNAYDSLANNSLSAVRLGYQYLTQLGREYAGDPASTYSTASTRVGWWVDPPDFVT